jgi:uncharacterized metal-binding protein YceD (DUF177 family)
MSNTSDKNFIINLEQLPNSGLEIKDSISLENINARMNIAKNNDIIFKENPELNLHITDQQENQKGQLIKIKGSLKFAYQQDCGICLDPQMIKQEKECHLILKRRTSSDEDQEDDLGLIYFENPTINLEEIIQEEIILSISPYLLPERDLSGKCLVCGKNCLTEHKDQKDDKTVLGSLLEKTLVKGRAN